MLPLLGNDLKLKSAEPTSERVVYLENSWSSERD